MTKGAGRLCFVPRNAAHALANHSDAPALRARLHAGGLRASLGAHGSRGERSRAAAVSAAADPRGHGRRPADRGAGVRALRRSPGAASRGALCESAGLVRGGCTRDGGDRRDRGRGRWRGASFVFAALWNCASGCNGRGGVRLASVRRSNRLPQRAGHARRSDSPRCVLAGPDTRPNRLLACLRESLGATSCRADGGSRLGGNHRSRRPTPCSSSAVVVPDRRTDPSSTRRGAA